MTLRTIRVALSLALFGAMSAIAQGADNATIFRQANESAARARWDEAIAGYGQLSSAGVHSPALYWNWAQAAILAGHKGEALWALLRVRELAPRDPSAARDVERLRAELGLDPSEVSLGLLGDLRDIARRFRFDAISIVSMAVSLLLLAGKKPRRSTSLATFVAGVLLLCPYVFGAWRSSRGVIIHKDAPLMDAARTEAIALANLREGEVVPILGEEGEFVRIQDASGARGFAHKSDVRKTGVE